MPILVTAQVENQTEQLYDGMLSALAPLLKRAEGFIMHSAHRSATGEWRVLEVWETKSQADQFFAKVVAPNLPPGVRPKRSVVELHSLVTPGA
jgi:heme-degrading monooxygenase HmoA